MSEWADLCVGKGEKEVQSAPIEVQGRRRESFHAAIVLGSNGGDGVFNECKWQKVLGEVLVSEECCNVWKMMSQGAVQQVKSKKIGGRRSSAD